MLGGGKVAAVLSRNRLLALIFSLTLIAAPRPAQAAPLLASRAVSTLTAIGGTTAMVAVQPGQAPLVALKADTPMTSASLYKLGVMAAVYTAVAAGTLSMDKTVTITQAELDFYGDDPATVAGTVLSIAEALRRTITVSDNSAAGALVLLLGYPAVNAAFAAIGMPHSHMGTPPDTPPSVPATLAQTTADDQAAFYLRLLAGRVVSPAASEEMLELLKGQRENDRLPELLPKGTVIAHKTGELDRIRNDSGIIFTPRGPLVCAVLTNDQDDVDGAAKAIAQEGLMVYNDVVGADPPPSNYGIGDGWFYTEANGHGGQGGTGYSLTDEYGRQFWAAFRQQGGVPSVGYPASHRFFWNGFYYQVMQREVFQWRPETGTVVFFNVFDVLHDDGFDAWLDATRQIPPLLDTSPDSKLTWPRVVRRHQQLLDAAPAIRSRYFADPAALDDYGLPMSIKDTGPWSWPAASAPPSSTGKWPCPGPRRGRSRWSTAAMLPKPPACSRAAR